MRVVFSVISNRPGPLVGPDDLETTGSLSALTPLSNSSLLRIHRLPDAAINARLARQSRPRPDHRCNG